MTQQIKLFAAQPNNLNLTPEIHMVEGETTPRCPLTSTHKPSATSRQ